MSQAKCIVDETTEPLLMKLKKLFPNELPKKRGKSSEEIAYLQGQQSIIDYMQLSAEGYFERSDPTSICKWT